MSMKLYYESINNELLVGDFINHYFNGSGINIFNISSFVDFFN